MHKAWFGWLFEPDEDLAVMDAYYEDLFGYRDDVSDEERRAAYRAWRERSAGLRRKARRKAKIRVGVRARTKVRRKARG